MYFLYKNVFQVSLRFTKTKTHFCAGTIIDTNWILTAAHCFTYIKRPEEVLVQYNSTQLNPIQPQYANVLDIKKHEGYNPTIAIHDIALLSLKAPINFKTNLRKVKLENNENFIYTNVTGLLLGWGLNAVIGLVICGLFIYFELRLR